MTNLAAMPPVSCPFEAALNVLLPWPAGHLRHPTDVPFHEAILVDAVVLRTLEGLVADALASGDGSALTDFLASRRGLDRDRLVAALGDIALLAQEPAGQTVEGQRLLARSREVSTRPRDVPRDLLEGVLTTAANIGGLVRRHASTAAVTAALGPALSALDALHSFDASVRDDPHLSGEEVRENDLVDSCLRQCQVSHADAIGMGDVCTRVFLTGRELFPKPSMPATRASWERFCGTLPQLGAPRVAEGADLTAAAARVAAFREGISRMVAWPKELVEEARGPLKTYAQKLLLAAEHGHAVVEWVQAAL